MDVSTAEYLVAGITTLSGAVAYLFKIVISNGKKCEATNGRLEKKVGEQSAEYKALVHGALMEQKETQIRSNSVMEKVADVMAKHVEQAAVTSELNRETLEYLKRKRNQ